MPKIHSRLSIVLAGSVALFGCSGGGSSVASDDAAIVPQAVSDTASLRSESGDREVAMAPANTPAVHITGEQAAIDSATGNLFEGGKAYRFVYKPAPLQSWVRQPWVSPTQSYLGYRAIGLEIFPAGAPTRGATMTTNDKANLTVGIVALDKPFYYGFAMKLSPDNFDVPTAGLLLAQIWQGTPYGPPVALTLTPNDPQFSCALEIRNNMTGGNPSARTVRLAVGKCKPGAWHTFRIGITTHYPGRRGTGEVTVWHNNMIVPAATYHGDVGYDPSKPVYVNGQAGKLQSDRLPNGGYTVFYGPYRGRQATRAQTFWANIKLGGTATAADPTIR